MANDTQSQLRLLETIGCDLGDNKSTLYAIRADGSEYRPKPISTTREGFTKFFTRPKVHVIIEVGTHSRWVSSVLTTLGHEVTVANPRQVKLIGCSDDKSDDHDPVTLARLGRADVKLLKPIQHRGDDVHADLVILKARDQLVRTRTALVNQVRSLTKSFGTRLPKCDAEYFHRKTKELVPQALLPAVEPLYQTLEHLAEQIKGYDQKLVELAKKYPDAEIVGQPRGVGLVTALAFILTLEDKKRFPNSRSAGAFLGLRPRKRQSGKSDPELRITKAGDPFLRKLMVQSANYVLGPFGGESDLRSWGLMLAQHGGKKAKQKARIAVARKLAVLMHRLWVTGEEYQPIGYHQARRQQKQRVA